MKTLETDSAKIIPEFELGDFLSFDPKVFLEDEAESVDDDNLKKIVLAFAVFFNDLKNLLWWNRYLVSNKPHNQEEKSGYNRQYAAMSDHVLRLTLGLLHELRVTIKKNAQILKSQPFEKLEGCLSVKARDEWALLKEFAINGKASDKYLYDILSNTRNNLAFHYWQLKQFQSGFTLAFKDAVGPKKKKCYISLGSSVKKIRFHFADAAVQGCSDKMMGEQKSILNEKANDLLERILLCVVNFIVAYIQQIKRAPFKKESN